MHTKLTAKEEIIMNLLWDNGPMSVKEMIEHYAIPKPHFNTVSTFVRGLEARGLVSHNAMGNTFQYYAVVSRADFSRKTLVSIIDKFYSKQALNAVSALVSEEKISVEELKSLIEKIEKGN
jgi:predicted transcriptional regulator